MYDIRASKIANEATVAEVVWITHDCVTPSTETRLNVSMQPLYFFYVSLLKINLMFDLYIVPKSGAVYPSDGGGVWHALFPMLKSFDNCDMEQLFIHWKPQSERIAAMVVRWWFF